CSRDFYVRGTTGMVKKKIVKKTAPRAIRTTPSQLVRQLERLDRELVKRLGERARLVQKLHKLGAPDDALQVGANGQPQVLNSVVEWNKGPLSDRSVRSVFREILSGCRALLRPVRVAYLGPMYSYTYLATIERFGESVELAPVATISAVFEELSRKHADYGVVPLENSTDGRVVDTLGMFARLPLRICGEVQLRIRHNLLAKCPRNEIQEVYSKPQALSQCRDWLAKHLPWARTVEMTSTAAAAQLAAGKQGAAAVASLLAASSYGLDVVAANIEDNNNNITRFAIIGGEAASRTRRDKTALMFEIPHKPGALADVMAVFKRSKLNLTWIESFPMASNENEYLFFVELEGHQTEAKVRRALGALERRTVRLEVLGSYAKSDPVD
ncbi:MAG: prephenate dehydratase, partial [Pirellulaceae bacterium]